jgi:hypothetical protein
LKQLLLMIFAATLACPTLADDLSDLAQCTVITDSLKRLTCYDGIAMKASRQPGRTAGPEDENRQKYEAAARDAFKAVRKLQATVEAGVSYSRYAPALAEAQLEVSMFSESPSAKMFADVTMHLLGAIKHYEMANLVWRDKFAHGSVRRRIYDRDLTNALMASYPNMGLAKDGQELAIDAVIPIVWAAASDEILRATKALPPQ